MSRKILGYLGLILHILFVFSCRNSVYEFETLKFPGNESVLKEKTDSVLRKMTVDEKIGQLNLMPLRNNSTTDSLMQTVKNDIKMGKIGAVLNYTDVESQRKLQELAVNESRMSIPLIFGLDVIHGYKTTFPVPVAEACSWDMDLIENSARMAAMEATASGIFWNYNPMVDIAKDARWGRIMEGSGEDPYLGSQIAIAKVKGYQGRDLSDNETMAACVKHYIGYGAVESGRDYNTVTISKRELYDFYIPPFKAANDAGAATFMTAFNDVFGIPATGNKIILREILKNDWKFKGFVVSDWNAVGEQIIHGTAKDSVDAAYQAIVAGCDMDMNSSVYVDHLKKLLDKGKLDITYIDDAVRRILRVKFLLGLFDDPYRYFDENRETSTPFHYEIRKAARESAKRSVVLLKNKDEILPIPDNVKRISLIGPLADNKRDMLGNWAAMAEPDSSVTVREALQNKLSPDGKIYYVKGCDINSGDKSGFSRAIEVSGWSKYVVLVMGESWTQSGEARNRTDIKLPGVQRDLIKAIKNSGKKVILVLMNGRPLDLSWESENVDAIVEAWFPGTEGGNAVVDVLFGDYNPSAKLVASFPRDVGQLPIYYNRKNTGRPAAEGDTLVFVSKYIDVENSPLYPFGFGLSYTSFDYSGMELNKSIIKNKKDTLEVTVKITNTGIYAGEEIVQCYIRDLVADVTRPVKELKDFKKIYLEAGEQKTVVFKIYKDKLAYYNRDFEYISQPGDFMVFVGPNSRDVQEAKFTLLK